MTHYLWMKLHHSSSNQYSPPRALPPLQFDYEYVPLIALRRQRRVGEEERDHQDPSLVDIAMTFFRTWAQTNHATGDGG